MGNSVFKSHHHQHKQWDYNNADIDTLCDKLRRVDWYAVFSGLDVNMMAKTFTDSVLTVTTDTISNKLITCNDNDPPWMTLEMKAAIRKT